MPGSYTSYILNQLNAKKKKSRWHVLFFSKGEEKYYIKDTI